MLRGLQTPVKKKIALGVLFSLATIGIVLDVIRTVYSIIGEAAAFYYLGVLFDIIELEIAVIISTLTAYRMLMGQHQKRTNTSRRNLLYSRQNSAGKTLDRTQHRQDNDLYHATLLQDLPKSKTSDSLAGRSDLDAAPLEHPDRV